MCDLFQYMHLIQGFPYITKQESNTFLRYPGIMFLLEMHTDCDSISPI